jgi:hypothetical protein
VRPRPPAALPPRPPRSNPPPPLQPLTPKAIFERFRGILHEGEIDKRVQYTIEGLFVVRKGNFADFKDVLPDLDLVDEDDQITHELSLDAELDPETSLGGGGVRGGLMAGRCFSLRPGL